MLQSLLCPPKHIKKKPRDSPLNSKQSLMTKRYTKLEGVGDMDTLEGEIRRFLKERGAIRVGFATLDTLAGGPPSSDLTYVLPEAKSAVSFALPLDLQEIRATLAKESHNAFEKNNFEVNIHASVISVELANWLEEKGYKAKGTMANNFYRKEVKGWQRKMPPDVSHRYVAVRSGVGSFGWSGNVGIKGYGASIILDTVVTSAELEATDPIPEEDSFCDQCKLCVTSCPPDEAAEEFEKMDSVHKALYC